MPARARTSIAVSIAARLAAVVMLLTACPLRADAELLINPGFEGSYTTVAPGWRDNAWPGGADGRRAPAYSLSRATGHDGTGASQQMTVTDIPPGGGLALWQEAPPYTAGTVWQLSVWLRASSDTTVKVLFRQPTHHYRAGAVTSVVVGTQWRQVTVRGGFDTSEPVQVGIRWMSASGTLWIDDASLTARAPSWASDRGPVPATFFGMGFNKFQAGGPYAAWPSVRPGLARVWDLGDTARWSNLETRKGVWNWAGLDHLVDAANRNGARVLYTMGQTPRWASARPDEIGAYPQEPGASAEPADIRHWRDYVRAVGRRYKGRIRSYELWNEPGFKGNYSGTVAQMVELARIAHAELKAIDLGIVVLTPSSIADNLDWLDDFLLAGGGRYADTVATHHYLDLAPETGLPMMEAVKSLVANHGLALPIWNTEGQVRAGEGKATPTPAEARASVARAYVTQAALGLDGFAWYCWDLAWPDSVALVDQTRFTALTPGGAAYREVRRWLVGQSIGRTVQDGASWTIETRRPDGYAGRIVWNTSGESAFVVPEGWGVVQVRTLSGEVVPARDGQSIAVSQEPVLLENRAKGLP